MDDLISLNKQRKVEILSRIEKLLDEVLEKEYATIELSIHLPKEANEFHLSKNLPLQGYVEPVHIKDIDIHIQLPQDKTGEMMILSKLAQERF